MRKRRRGIVIERLRRHGAGMGLRKRYLRSGGYAVQGRSRCTKRDATDYGMPPDMTLVQPKQMTTTAILSRDHSKKKRDSEQRRSCNMKKNFRRP
jgi:hypothetical protein